MRVREGAEVRVRVVGSTKQSPMTSGHVWAQGPLLQCLKKSVVRDECTWTCLREREGEEGGEEVGGCSAHCGIPVPRTLRERV